MKKRYFLCLQFFILLLCIDYSFASSKEIVDSILNFKNDEFFAADKSVLVVREAKMLEKDFLGIVVNAPRHISTLSQNKLPLIFAVRSSGVRDWQVSFADNCILVGTNMQDGTVYFAKALVDEKNSPSSGGNEEVTSGPKPPGLALALALLTKIDVRRLLDIDWQSGIWSLAIINYDWPSNSVVVELKGKADSYPPESTYAKAPIKAKFCTTAQSNHQLNITGTFSVPVQDFHLQNYQYSKHIKKNSHKDIAAVVPVTVAILKQNWDEPLQFDHFVPIYGPPLRAGMIANGNMNFDAFENIDVRPLNPGKYLCYIIINGKIIGPEKFTILKKY